MPTNSRQGQSPTRLLGLLSSPLNDPAPVYPATYKQTAESRGARGRSAVPIPAPVADGSATPLLTSPPRRPDGRLGPTESEPPPSGDQSEWLAGSPRLPSHSHALQRAKFQVPGKRLQTSGSTERRAPATIPLAKLQGPSGPCVTSRAQPHSSNSPPHSAVATSRSAAVYRVLPGTACSRHAA